MEVDQGGPSGQAMAVDELPDAYYIMDVKGSFDDPTPRDELPWKEDGFLQQRANALGPQSPTKVRNRYLLLTRDFQMSSRDILLRILECNELQWWEWVADRVDPAENDALSPRDIVESVNAVNAYIVSNFGGNALEFWTQVDSGEHTVNPATSAMDAIDILIRVTVLAMNLTVESQHRLVFPAALLELSQIGEELVNAASETDPQPGMLYNRVKSVEYFYDPIPNALAIMVSFFNATACDLPDTQEDADSFNKRIVLNAPLESMIAPSEYMFMMRNIEFGEAAHVAYLVQAATVGSALLFDRMEHVAAATIAAHYVRARSPEYIRAIFDLEDDISEEERENVRLRAAMTTPYLFVQP